MENPEYPILIPTLEGRRGHPVLIRRIVFPELANLDEQEAGLKLIIRREIRRVKHIETADKHLMIAFATPIEYEQTINCCYQ